MLWCGLKQVSWFWGLSIPTYIMIDHCSTFLLAQIYPGLIVESCNHGWDRVVSDSHRISPESRAV